MKLSTPALLEALRHGATIALVGGLIWLFAEAQSVGERTVDVRVSVSAPDGSAWIVQTPDPAWTGVARLRVQGARAALDEAVRALAAGVTLTVGAPGVPAQPGRRVVDLREALGLNPPLDRAVVTLAAVEPRALELVVDELVRIEDVPIRASLPGVATVGDVGVTPVSATVLAPASIRDEIARRLAETGVPARLGSAALSSLPEGGPQSHEARLSAPDEFAATPGVRVTPNIATLTFTVRSTTERIAIPSVPIWPMTPPTEINRWDIVVEPVVVRDVSLIGPSDVIQRIRSGELRVIATLRLSSDELEQRITSKAPALLGLPDSVRVESSLAPVSVTITPRVRPAGDGGDQTED